MLSAAKTGVGRYLKYARLLALLSRYLRNEVRELHKDGIRVRFIGERRRFSQRQQKLMQQSESLTCGNTGATVVIAVDYGGQWDIAQAAQKLARQVQAGKSAAAGYYAGAD